ncbi:hypothetical protein VNI00_007631 [Paramarasmius palmivorus]|uniref:MYND-type domain-containing protein n=1 Tax=Paramarasmius palmivorus TaxID=297713 RepID=A0AAW0D3E2_9AGAR
MPTGIQLLTQAEQYYAQSRIDDALEFYTKAIKKIVKDENLLGTFSLISPDPNLPRETLGAAWHNFVGVFKDPLLHRNQHNSPDAYKLLASYRPNSNHQFERFRTDRQKLYLAGMRITAGLTLGLTAWDAQDRATAVKRYREALDLAAKYPQYDDQSKATDPWERHVSREVQQIRDNITVLLTNDETNTRIMAEEFDIRGAGEHRKEILGIGMLRMEGDGSCKFVPNVQVASDKCGFCGKRDAKLMMCSACGTATYCNATCQRADWQ